MKHSHRGARVSFVFVCGNHTFSAHISLLLGVQTDISHGTVQLGQVNYTVLNWRSSFSGDLETNFNYVFLIVGFSFRHLL